MNKKPYRLDRAWKVFLILSPIYLILTAPGLDNFLWCEELFWIGRVGLFRENPAELLRFYGRDFNPVSVLALDLQVRLLGPNPFDVHLADTIMQIASGLFLAGLFGRWLKAPVSAGVLAFLWVCSRHTDEAIFWMGARPISLSFFLILGAWLLADSRSRWGKPVSVAVFVAAVLSKETAVLFVPLYTVATTLYAGGDWKGRLRAGAFRSLPFWAVLFIYVGFRGYMALQGESTTYQDITPVFLLGKFGYIVSNFLEVPLLEWDSPWRLMIAAALLAAGFLCCGRSGRLGSLWIVISILPFLPLEKHSPRYELFVYPGALLIFGGAYLNLLKRFPSAMPWIGGALAGLMILVQSFFVYLDEKDYDMRSRYVQELDRRYVKVRNELPDAQLGLIDASGVSAQPEINDRTLVPKLNANLPGEFWGIVPRENLVGYREFVEGRVWLPSEKEPPQAWLVLTPDGFVIKDTLPVRAQSNIQSLKTGRIKPID